MNARGSVRSAALLAVLLAAGAALVVVVAGEATAPRGDPIRHTAPAEVAEVEAVEAPVTSSRPQPGPDGARPDDAVASAEPVAEDAGDDSPRARPVGLLRRDGAPWSGGAVRFLALDGKARPTGREVSCAADEAGRFPLDALAPGWWRIAPGSAWPDGCTVDAAMTDDPMSPSSSPSLDAVAVCVPPATPPSRGDPALDAARGWCEVTADSGAYLTVEVSSPLALRGRVLDAGGAPVAGARVWRSIPDATRVLLATTGFDGAFAVDVPWTGPRLDLVASARGKAPVMVALAFESRAAARPAPIAITLGAAVVPVLGVARDTDGAPVAAALLTACVDLRDEATGRRVCWREQTTSDGEGRFALEVGAGTAGPWCAWVEVAGEHAGFLPSSKLLDLGPDSPPVELVLQRPSRVEGVVVGPDGLPVEGAQVRAPSMAVPGVTTGPDGRFAFDGVPEHVDLRVDGTRYAPCQLRATLPLTRPLEVRLATGETVEGRVVDGTGVPRRCEVRGSADLPDGEALRDPPRGVVVERPCRVQVRSATDAAGGFVLGPFPRGGRVALDADDVGQVLAPAGARDVVLVGSLRRPVRVRVRPVAAESGRAIVVSLTTDRGLAILPAAQASFDVSDDERHARFTAPGRVPVDRALRGDEKDLGVVPLELAGGVALRLRWPRSPLRQLRATWRDPDGRAREERLDDLGSRPPDAPWLLDGLVPGLVSVEVTLRPSSGPARSTLVTVVTRAGEVTTVDLDLVELLRSPAGP